MASAIGIAIAISGTGVFLVWLSAWMLMKRNMPPLNRKSEKHRGSEMSGVKICKTCRFAKPDWIGLIFGSIWKYSKCRHPKSGWSADVNPVTGTLVPRHYELCGSMRSQPNACGKSGRFWEPKA